MDRAAARFWQAVRARRADRGLRRLRRRRRRGGGADHRLAAPARAAAPRSTSPTASRRATARTCRRWRALGASHDLIVCVDCGTLSHEPIAAAGCDVIVLDHHLGAETLPPAFAVVNPNRQDEDGAFGYLCAAAVVFLMLVAVNRLMRAEGASGPDLLALLDLVALATVADVAPLVGLNRALVRQGLAVMARGGAAGDRGAGGGGGADRRAVDLRPRLRARAAGQRRRADRGRRPRGAAARDRRPARGGGAGRAAARAERRAPRDRGGGPGRGRGAGGGRAPRGRWSGPPARAGIRAWSASSRRG